GSSSALLALAFMFLSNTADSFGIGPVRPAAGGGNALVVGVVVGVGVGVGVVVDDGTVLAFCCMSTGIFRKSAACMSPAPTSCLATTLASCAVSAVACDATGASGAADFSVVTAGAVAAGGGAVVVSAAVVSEAGAATDDRVFGWIFMGASSHDEHRCPALRG